MREPPVKKTLYWCDRCDVPLIGKQCGCGSTGRAVPLLSPYDVRPALAADMALIRDLVSSRFGPVPVPQIVLLNKAGGTDRNELAIVHGVRFGWLSFDPVARQFRFDIAPEALPFVIGRSTKGVIDLGEQPDHRQGRIGGKKVPVRTTEPDGTVIVRYRGRYGTGVLKDGQVRVKELLPVAPADRPDPGWDIAVERNRYHLKNLERNAIRSIRQHIHDRPVANVSFSGGKDSTVVLALARKAGVESTFFIDTGIEFPETVAFVRSMGVGVVEKAGDFWAAVEKAGPPAKDGRWCCKLLKLKPLKIHLATTGPCVTIQGNRWYESWNRADLDITSQNPANPLQLNISPIRNWRALEVWLYLWWSGLPVNPLYDLGLERIGCYLCPAMLESEHERLRELHPGLAERWDAFLVKWARDHGLPPGYAAWGLWRWKELPPKMVELCREHGIRLAGLQVAPGAAGSSVKAAEYTGTPGVPAAAAGGTPGRDPDEAGRPDPGGPDRTISSGPGHDDRERPASGPDSARGAPVGTPEQSGETGSGARELSSRNSGQPAFGDHRKDFPILADLVYLDSAASGLSPEPVIAAVLDYERNYRSAGGGVHRLSRIADQRYWHAHERVAGFIGAAGNGTVVFTPDAPHAIALVARSISWKPGDRVLATLLDTRTHLAPWQELRAAGVGLDIAGITGGCTTTPDLIGEAVSPSTRLVVVPHVSGAPGSVNPVAGIAEVCHDRGIPLLVDGTYSAPHVPVDVGVLGCDYFCFSGRLMPCPSGPGVLWMKDPLPPAGGEPVPGRVRPGDFRHYEVPRPDIGRGIALGAAVGYLENAGMERVRIHEEALAAALIDGLAAHGNIRVITPRNAAHAGIVSFAADGISPADLAVMLDEEEGILVGSGDHDCPALMERLGIPEGMVRVSTGVWSERQDIDLLLAAIDGIMRGL